MPGAALPVTERAPSLRISLRKKAIAQAQLQQTSPVPTPSRSSSKSSSKKRGRPVGPRSKASTSSKAASEGKTKQATRGRSSRAGGKHSKPWEVDEDDQSYDYVSCSETDSSSEEDYSSGALQSQMFLEDEQDADCLTNEDGFHSFEEDADERDRLPWVELPSTEIPPLFLPESSNDIPVPKEYLLDTVELYELLRSYWRTLRLTPFLFEDFCAALLSSDNSRLLSEIHIVLLRICFKNDDEEQVHFSGNETNNAYNIVTACLEPMTYAEVLRQYLSSDSTVPVEVLEAINAPNYPFVDFSARLVLITFLSSRFLYSNEYKRIVVATGGRIEHEESCRSCCKGGDLLACGTCEAVFHPDCVSAENRLSDWVCELCQKNQISGVQDCLPLDECKSKQPLRMEPIGRDRHGRFYWFVARRIFVHNMDESDLRYYSTAPQFYELVKAMDPSLYEFNLCKVFYERLSDILEQMSVTLEISSDRRDTLYRENYNTSKPLPAEVYLQQDNMHLMADILANDVKSDAGEDKSDEEPKSEDDSFGSLADYFKTMLGLSQGRLVNNFWSGNVEENELLQYSTREERCRPDSSTLFRMGCPSDDAMYSKYVNYYVEHKYGEHPATKKKMVDKKKYLCSKFSLVEDGEWAFEWSTAKGHGLYGNEKLQTCYVAWTIGKLLRKIPIELMHRKWPEALPSFKKDLDSPAASWRSLRDLLLRLECGMRRTLFLPQWWNNLGHTRLTRTTVEDRERMVKETQRRKKEEKEASEAVDDEIIVVKHTRLPHGISRELTRMKDEKYRVYGRGRLGGWMWISGTLVREIRESPCYHLHQQSDTREGEVTSGKCRRLRDIVARLRRWRYTQEETKESRTTFTCYSPSCRTSGVVKACDISKKKSTPKGVFGEDLPWPLPEVNNFVSRGSKRKSIFVLPQITLRKLARTGGSRAIYVPSFSATAKGNLQYWNYPTPRPCFDLCWRWLTVNCTSLQAVALQLRILWASIRWHDLKPEDDDPDRRVVSHFPDRDERRWISLHKEYGPPCIYERYRLSIEVLPLDDDNAEEEDDLSWTSSERERRKSARRRKPTMQSSRLRRVTQIKEEWVDGVDLKLYEIYDYWRGFSERFNKSAKPLPAPRVAPITRSATTKLPQHPSEKTATPVMPVPQRRVVSVQNRINQHPVRPPIRQSTTTVEPHRRPTPTVASRTPRPTRPHPAEAARSPAVSVESVRKSVPTIDYRYFNNGNERRSTTRDSSYSEGNELTGWEPRAAKRARLSPRMDSARLVQALTPTSRFVPERSYHVGYIRGGGRGTAVGFFL
ncbi:hypothetical protein Q1695_010758 [Nippostrongylus brasiliensis]|nr:hypothetical protein Q1695_010758 [Nippostrongylus brasiliensis]